MADRDPKDYNLPPEYKRVPAWLDADDDDLVWEKGRVEESDLADAQDPDLVVAHEPAPAPSPALPDFVRKLGDLAARRAKKE